MIGLETPLIFHTRKNEQIAIPSDVVDKSRALQKAVETHNFRNKYNLYGNSDLGTIALQAPELQNASDIESCIDYAQKENSELALLLRTGNNGLYDVGLLINLFETATYLGFNKVTGVLKEVIIEKIKSEKIQCELSKNTPIPTRCKNPLILAEFKGLRPPLKSFWSRYKNYALAAAATTALAATGYGLYTWWNAR